MTKDEAIKTIKEALYDGHPCMIENLFRDALAALDSLAESKPLDPEIQTLVQDNFWELAGKPKATEPSEDAVISGTFKNVSSHDHAMNEEEIKNFYRDTDGETVDPSEDVPIIHGKAELEEHDERIRRECADDLAHGSWGNYLAIHLLEHLIGQRFIRTSEDIGIPEAELPRLLEQARKYECDLAVKHATIMGEAKE